MLSANPALPVDLVLRWLHIVGAVTLVGGAICWRMTLVPTVAELPDELRGTFAANLRRRWSKLVMISSGTLLVSGLVNFMFVVTRFKVPPTYHMVFGIKFLLALAVFVLASLLAGRTSLAERLRQQERFWLSANMMLAIIVVCLGGMLKVSDRQAKPAQSSRLTSVPTALVQFLS